MSLSRLAQEQLCSSWLDESALKANDKNEYNNDDGYYDGYAACSSF